MELIDTHCHIHSLDFPLDGKQVLIDAVKNGVTKVICVGVDLEDSKQAIKFVKHNENSWASIGIHPHEARHYLDQSEKLDEFSKLTNCNKVVALGECGLDYFYDHSTKIEQRTILEFQLQLAQKYNLPVIFHVRDAFTDFWPILDGFKDIKGVIHSFTSDINTLNEALARGLYIGLNGIMTFTKKTEQLDMAKAVPLDKLVLETDSPYLTPTPIRGTICQPKHVRLTAEFLANLRVISLEELAENSVINANKLFNLSVSL